MDAAEELALVVFDLEERETPVPVWVKLNERPIESQHLKMFSWSQRVC